MDVLLLSTLSNPPLVPEKTLMRILYPGIPLRNYRLGFGNGFLQYRPFFSSGSRILMGRWASVSSTAISAIPSWMKNYEFYDCGPEVELRLDIGAIGVESSNDIFVDEDDLSLLIRVKTSGTLRTLMQTDCLFERIKPAETIWYIDEEQLVVNLKKQDSELKWPDAIESWESLRMATPQLLKGTSIYVIGESTEINEAVANVLAIGIGYTPLNTSELVQTCSGRSIDSWVEAEGVEPVAETEALILESLSSHVRVVVATLGGCHGAASQHDKWRHLHAGFTIWLSESKADDEWSAREEASRSIKDGNLAYTKADVKVKFARWDAHHAQEVAQGCLKALKQLVLSDKKLTGKKSIYIRLGCRGDWPDIRAPGWDPSTGTDTYM
ncbi:hypothetical protein HPP92_014441 [Vanilla planifolia]|uniref:CS domain-containing protein n=1 Tax=Vanilla planifolia TaxID=51239 RepID=A0A835QK04_VANPL|nr:hypothetical protein HPP92_014848 [Vanilla planifolia]KAG0474755.1 hypothetical protein HPP92_014441 [Vanilla planifolia]